MKIEVSIGEVIDKVTILSIKLEKFKDDAKVLNVMKEYAFLVLKLADEGITMNFEDLKKLKEVNLKLWDIEDNIRIKESKQEFDREFIELARSVYFTNDKRAKLKKRINQTHNSEMMEEKEHVDYKK